MLSRSPFQPLSFCDSVILWSVFSKLQVSQLGTEMTLLREGLLFCQTLDLALEYVLSNKERGI